MRAITYQGIKDVEAEHAYSIFAEKEDNCIKVVKAIMKCFY